MISVFTEGLPQQASLRLFGHRPPMYVLRVAHHLLFKDSLVFKFRD